MRMQTLRVGPIIDGKELNNGHAGSCGVVNPATGQTIATQAVCDETCVARIVESSARAYHSPEWQKLSAAERGYLLLNLASLVEKHAEELDAMTRAWRGSLNRARGHTIPRNGKSSPPRSVSICF